MNVATKYAAAIVLMLSVPAGCGDLENDETVETVDDAKLVVDDAKLVVAEPDLASLNGTYDGRNPSSVSGCSSNFHIGSYSSNRIRVFNRFTGGTDDYGWWEWRYSNTGSCSGYQWVRLHIEKTLAISGTYLSTRYWRTNAPNTFFFYAVNPTDVNVRVWGGMWSTIASLLKPKTYDSQILYSRGVVSCADLASNLALASTWDFFGWAAIQARICA